MTTATLVISLVALVVAAFAAVFTGQQAQAARLSASIDVERRHDERAPRLDASVERLNGSDDTYWRLRLRLETQDPLSHVSVHLVDAPIDVQFTRGTSGVDPQAPFPVHAAQAIVVDGVALRPHQPATWQLEMSSIPSELKLSVSASAGDEHWTLLVPVTGLG